MKFAQKLLPKSFYSLVIDYQFTVIDYQWQVLFSKRLSTEFTTFQLILKWCNRLQYIGNRLPVCLNVEIQIQL